MNNRRSPDNQLKLVDENADETVKLRITEDIAVLKPQKNKSSKIKSQDPDVSEIMPDEEPAVDQEENWGHKKSAVPHGWLIISALILIGVAIWSVRSVLDAQSQNKVENQIKKNVLVDLQQEDKEVKQTLLQMEQCVTGYLTARTPDALLRFVRQPERVKPLIKHHYQSRSLSPSVFQKFDQIRSIGIENHSFVFTNTRLIDGSSRKLLLEQLDDGAFKVDWESDVCYLPVDWKTWIETRPTEPVNMRVYISPDHFYAYEFRDENQYQCFKLTTRDSDGHLFAFTTKDSKAHFDILRILERSEEPSQAASEPMTLRLRFPKNSESKHCVVIDSVVAPRWTLIQPTPAPTKPAPSQR